MTAKPSQRTIRKVLIVTIGLLGVLIVIVAGIWLILSLQISRYGQYWQKRAQAVSPPGALIYVALGNSAAQGVGASNPANGYVGLLADKLEAKTGRPVQVINLSVSGAKVADVVNDQLPKLAALARPADIITLEIGANDIKTFEQTAFRRDFSAVLDRLPTSTFVADIAYFGNGRYRRNESRAARASDIIAELSRGRGTKFVPLHAVTKRAGWRVNGLDLFHPGNWGHQVWAEAFWGVIEPGL